MPLLVPFWSPYATFRECGDALAFRPFNWNCPYCDRAQTVTERNFSRNAHHLGVGDNEWGDVSLCSSAISCSNQICQKITLIVSIRPDYLSSGYGYEIKWKETPFFEQQLLPESTAKPQPEFIPLPLRDDYNEACRILSLSPKASATLARRCLQGMIRDFANINKPTLKQEIDALQKLFDEGKAPLGVTPESVKAIDNVRTIGNIGAHMEKDINLIIPVDPSEASLLIELIEMLFLDWYVAREARKERFATLSQIADQKRAAISAGKGVEEPAT